MTAWFIRSLNRFFPSQLREPMTVFRYRSLFMVLLMLCFMCCLQTFLAVGRALPASVLVNYVMTDLIVLFLIYWIRRTKHLERFAFISLTIAGITATVANVAVGPHSFVPLMMWSPFLVFFGVLVSGPRYAPWIVFFVLLQVLSMVFLPFVVGFAPTPLNASLDAFHARVQLTLIFSGILPLVMTRLYSRFFQMAKDETQRIQTGVEKMRNKTLLTRFANQIATDMEAPLLQLESLVAETRASGIAQVQSAKASIQSMSQVTDRYRRLSFPSYLQENHGISLGDFLESIRHFSPDAELRIDVSVDTSRKLRGDQVFTLQLILCLGLMNTPIRLAVEQKMQLLRFTFTRDSHEASGVSAEDFFREMRQMLDDMQGSLQQIESTNAPGSPTVHIQIPLSQIS